LYSVKLKIEFWILNQLTAMASRKLSSSNSGFGSQYQPGTSQAETVFTETRKDSTHPTLFLPPTPPKNQQSKAPYSFPPPTPGIIQPTEFDFAITSSAASEHGPKDMDT
jgi:hypothetical protein